MKLIIESLSILGLGHMIRANRRPRTHTLTLAALIFLLGVPAGQQDTKADESDHYGLKQAILGMSLKDLRKAPFDDADPLVERDGIEFTDIRLWCAGDSTEVLLAAGVPDYHVPFEIEYPDQTAPLLSCFYGGIRRDRRDLAGEKSFQEVYVGFAGSPPGEAGKRDGARHFVHYDFFPREITSDRERILARITIATHHDNFRDLYPVLITVFGNPDVTESVEYQNGHGQTLTGRIAAWRNDVVTILAQEYAGSSRQSGVVLELNEVQAKLKNGDNR